MSTKNGKKSRNRSNRHDEPSPASFKQPPPTIPSLDEIPLPTKPLKKNIIPEQPIETIICIQQDNDSSPNANENTSRDTSSSSNRCRNTPQKTTLNNGSGNGKMTSQGEEVFIANGNGDDQQVTDHVLATNDSIPDVYMEPLVLDSNEPEPELLHLCDGESDSPDLPQLDDQSALNKNSPRCATRRSQTRYVPTPETPHSFMEGTPTIASEDVGQVDGKTISVETADEASVKITPKSNTAETDPPSLPSTPTITVTPSTPPTPPIPCQTQFETSSTHSTDNLSTDSATDNCSTRAIVGSDVTRMNLDDQQLTMTNDYVDDDARLDLAIEDSMYAEIAEAAEKRKMLKERDSVDTRGSSRYASFDLGEVERPRSREGSIARALTGRKSIRPGTDYRKYLLERGMGGVEGSYTSTLDRPSSSSGIKRKTTTSDFLTSTPNTALKRRKLDTPQTTINWFSYISQPLYNLKNRLARSVNIASNIERTRTNTTPKLTGYKSSIGDDTIDTAQVVDTEQELVDVEEDEEIETTGTNEDVEDDVSLGVEAMPDEYNLDEGKQAKEVPIVVEMERSNRKSCVIM